MSILTDSPAGGRPRRMVLRPVQVDPWLGLGGRLLRVELARAVAALGRIEAMGVEA